MFRMKNMEPVIDRWRVHELGFYEDIHCSARIFFENYKTTRWKGNAKLGKRSPESYWNEWDGTVGGIRRQLFWQENKTIGEQELENKRSFVVCCSLHKNLSSRGCVSYRK